MTTADGWDNNNFMNKTPRFIVRNTKTTPQTSNQTRRQSLSRTQRLMETMEQFHTQQEKVDTENRLCQLQSNLKVLEKKYRANLKQGFDHKIKAYRLQAVVDRKMMQQAIELTAKEQEMELLEQKIQLKQKIRSWSRERALLSSYQKQQKEQYLKRRNEDQKRKLSLTLYERNKAIDQHHKRTHDQILWEDAHSDRKKLYMEEIRRISQKRELLQDKRQLLGRILSNTKRLKELRLTLGQLQGGQQGDTFLTL